MRKLRFGEFNRLQVTQLVSGSLNLDPGMLDCSSILPWRIPWTDEPGGLQSVGLQSWTQLRLTLSFSFHDPDPMGMQTSTIKI